MKTAVEVEDKELVKTISIFSETSFLRCEANPMSYIYIAGPLFNTHERYYLEQIAKALEDAGHRTYLPHRDAGLLDGQITTEVRASLFHSDIQALEQCELVVALLTGADHDSGTSAELGIMWARGKLCFGITDDFRWLNNMIWGMCGEGKRLVRDLPELLKIVANTDNRL